MDLVERFGRLSRLMKNFSIFQLFVMNRSVADSAGGEQIRKFAPEIFCSLAPARVLF